MMRKSAIIILLVVVAIFAVIAFFARDHYIESALESVLELAAGAKVEIDNFHFSVLKLECSWDRLQIANSHDPWRNILETGKAEFDIEGRPLFWKRLIIREMSLSDVRSGTKRETDGSLPRKAEQPQTSEPTGPDIRERAVAVLKKQLGDLPVLNLDALGKDFKPDSLIDLSKLFSVQQYEKLTQFADSSLNYWQESVKPDQYQRKYAAIEEAVKDLELDKIKEKDAAALAITLKKVNDILKQIRSFKQEVHNKYQASQKTMGDLKTQLNAGKNALQKDIDQAKQLARLKDLDVRDMGLILFGEPLIRQFDEIMSYVSIGRKYLPTAKKLLISEKEEKPPRLKGQDIHYPFHYRYPRFLLREAKLTAATAAGDTSRGYFFSGNLSGLTNEPKVYGKPTRFALNSAREEGNQYNISGSFDRLHTVPHDSLWIAADNWNVGKIKLAQSSYLPHAMNAQKGKIAVNGFFIGRNIDLSMEFSANPVTFHFNNVKGKVAQIMQDVLSSLKKLDIQASLNGRKPDLHLRMRSNVDQVLARRLKAILADNIRQARLRVETYVRAEVEKRQARAMTLVKKYKDTINDKIDVVRQKIEARLAEVEQKKKEIEDRIEAEKNKAKKRAKEEADKLKNKAKDKLDGFLKKKKP